MTSPASPRAPAGKVKPAGPLVINERDPAVLKHGILIKQGGSYKSWKKRYFYIYGKSNFRNVVLTYHKKPNEPAIDELALEGATIEVPDPGNMLNLKPKGQTRVYQFKSTNDSSDELLEWYSAVMEHTSKLEDLLFPGTTTTVSTMHVFSTLQDRFGAKAGHIRALFQKMGIDYNQPSISRDPLTKLLRFLPPLRKENAANQGDSPTANLDVLASNRCGNTLSHWARLMYQPWFFMYKDNATVYKHLQSRDVGSFVVRFGRFDDIFVLTVKGTFEILHFPVVSTPAGFGLPNSASFPSIYAFLRNYVNSPLPSGISLTPFKVVDLEDVAVGAIAITHSEPDSPVVKEKRSKNRDSGHDVASSPGTQKAKKNRPPPPSGPPPAGPPPSSSSHRSFMDPPPSLPSVPDDDLLEPPPSLSTPGGPPPTLSSTVSLANVRLTTAYEVTTTPPPSYPTPWKSPSGLSKAEGWKTAKHGLCRRILLQKGLKVMKEKEMEQVSHILRIFSPDGPIRILKCYALENARLVTLFEANNSFLEAKLKTYNTEQPKWAKEDPTGARNETNQVYEHFAARCAWNKDTPLKIVPLIYYASEEKLQAVEAEGFDKSQEIPDGPYGAGCYLTRSLEEARIKSNNGPFIIAFAAPGRVYPTIEPAIVPNEMVASKKVRASVGAAPATLYGKPCKDGYDAHFVRTCGSTKDEPGTGGIFHSGWTGSEWDQMVLYQMTQAVPRYLVYLE